MLILFECYDRISIALRTKLEWSEEEIKEHHRIGRTYNINSFVRDQKLQLDLTNKIYLQQDALKALPPHLIASANEIDHQPPPKNRPWAMWSTPPIKGFDSTPYEEVTEKDEDDEDEEDAILKV
jgi:hypothetical protein